MTIGIFFYTFGFLLPIDLCLKALGFTEDNLTDEIREKIDHWSGGLNDAQRASVSTMLRFWFEMVCDFFPGRPLSYNFDLYHNGITIPFILRSFAHDNLNGYHDKYFVVGIDIGSISRFGGYFVPPVSPGDKYGDSGDGEKQGENYNDKHNETLENGVVVIKGRNKLELLKAKRLQMLNVLINDNNWVDVIINHAQNEYSDGDSKCPDVFCTSDDCDCCS